MKEGPSRSAIAPKGNKNCLQARNTRAVQFTATGFADSGLDLLSIHRLGQFYEHLDGDGAIIFVQACALGLESIVSKRRDLPYRSGRCKGWIKIKNSGFLNRYFLCRTVGSDRCDLAI
jgi:ATP-dependent DNA ligase